MSVCRCSRLLLFMLAALPAPIAQAQSGSGGQSRAEVVLAGGCYWGVEAVFRHVRGVFSATSGFATAAQESGDRRPAVEAVHLVYDPAKISYRQLLEIFFTVAHDPTQVDRQGPDVGPQYRSVVFVENTDQRGTVRGYLDSLRAARVFPRPIATEVATLVRFQVADNSHQNYAARHPDDPYIVINDRPKIEALRRRFPELYRRPE